MQDDSTAPKKRKHPSGAEQRRRRLAKGLPAYTPGQRAARVRNEAKRQPRRRAERGARVRAMKLERGCADCGYNAHPAALDFDHLPGGGKRHGIADIQAHYPMATILAEIAKCEVVCANCHRIRTFNRRTAPDGV